MMDTRKHGIGMTSQRTRTRMVERLREQGIRDEQVLAAINTVPRHLFVDEALASRAYEDIALPIGYGQTISTPYSVARMCELVNSGALGRVLEIGSGCGYQAAVLAQLAREVCGIERVAGLVVYARRRLRELRCQNVLLKHGDGSQGFEKAAPFDAIIVAAAVPHKIDAWMQQLAVDGSLVYPFGASGQQTLIRVARTAEGYEETALESVKFVPLLSGVR
jgi:protein-L-isoaspartate(D-aspartate) O-methyltransferase